MIILGNCELCLGMGSWRIITNEIYLSWRIIEMNCRHVDVSDGNIGLCYDRQN